MTTTNDHKQAIANLGFVHERLPIMHEGNGSWFVHSTDFNSGASENGKQPSIRVTIDSDSTEIHVFDGYELAWSARFSSSTPSNVINQAVAAARSNV